MKKRINTIACALLLAALAAPVSHARAPIARDKVVTQVQSGAFAGLGHEGSGLRVVRERATLQSVLVGLGHEGSGVRKHVAKKQSIAATNVLAGLGNEGSALVAQ